MHTTHTCVTSDKPKILKLWLLYNYVLNCICVYENDQVNMSHEISCWVIYLSVPNCFNWSQRTMRHIYSYLLSMKEFNAIIWLNLIMLKILLINTFRTSQNIAYCYFFSYQYQLFDIVLLFYSFRYSHSYKHGLDSYVFCCSYCVKACNVHMQVNWSMKVILTLPHFS